MELAELALDFAVAHLQPGGDLLVKVFQGSGFDAFFRAVRSQFERTATRKPDASRSRSSGPGRPYWPAFTATNALLPLPVRTSSITTSSFL